MSVKQNMMGLGLAPLAADAVNGEVDGGVTATGSTSQANSYAISRSITVVTTAAANTGVRLPTFATPNDEFTVVNYGANTMNVYPPVGGRINNGTLNAAVTLAAGKRGDFLCVTADGLGFSYVVGS